MLELTTSHVGKMIILGKRNCNEEMCHEKENIVLQDVCQGAIPATETYKIHEIHLDLLSDWLILKRIIKLDYSGFQRYLVTTLMLKIELSHSVGQIVGKLSLSLSCHGVNKFQKQVIEITYLKDQRNCIVLHKLWYGETQWIKTGLKLPATGLKLPAISWSYRDRTYVCSLKNINKNESKYHSEASWC